MLSPYCVIRQDLSLESYIELNEKKPDAKALEDISLKLGCIDLRTARKHISRIEQKVSNTQKSIAEFLSSKFQNLPHLTPNIGVVTSAKTFILELSGYFTKAYGKIISDSFFSLSSIINVIDRRDTFSSTFVYKTTPFQDTS